MVIDYSNVIYQCFIQLNNLGFSERLVKTLIVRVHT